MKTILKYPRTISELHRLINFLNVKIDDLKENKTPKNKAREWIRLCQAANDIRTQALQQKVQNTKVNFNDDIHHRIIKDLEKWMKINNFPIW